MTRDSDYASRLSSNEVDQHEGDPAQLHREGTHQRGGNGTPTVDRAPVGGSLADVLEAITKRPTSAAYFEAARRVDRFREDLRLARVALLASFTIESLTPFLKVEAARHGFAPDVYVGPFGTTHQELLNPASGCVAHCPDVVFVAQLIEDVCPPLGSDFLALSEREVDAHIEDIVSSLVTALEAFRRSSTASVVVHNFAVAPSPPMGIHEPMAEFSQTEAVLRLNRRLVQAVRTVPGAYVLDYNAAAAFVGYRHWYDDKMWHLAHTPLSAQALPVLAARQATFLRALLTPPRKCLVLDLDNTLWGGVVAETGLSGIHLGPTYPGNVYRDFQSFLLQLYRCGVLLAISSKNNRSDVDEVFRSHPHMVLKPEHFAAIKVDWRPKPENVAEIAADLNLALESLVFLDDSPVECALMRQMLPQVLTLQAPKDATKSRRLVTDSGAFERLSLTSEDLGRGQMYQEQLARQREARAAGSVDEFLRGLAMTARIGRVEQFEFPRVLDLLHKTNQFNVTTRRYSATELAEIIADPNQAAFFLQLSDRFGNNGIVGVAIVRVRGSIADIDTFLLSCRVIGRTAETALLATLVEWARDRGLQQVHGEFVSTSKNAPAADFYARHGFTEVEHNGHGHRWRLDLSASTIAWPSCIRLAERDWRNAVA